MTTNQDIPPPTAAQINDAAALWLHKVDIGDVREDDAELQQWLGSNPRHYVAYYRLEASRKRTELLKTLPSAMNDATMPARRHVGRFWPVPLAAAALVFAILGGQWFYSAHWTEETYAARDTPAHIVQPDRSVISLDAQSEARVRYSPFRRRVDLLKGTGFFVVAKDSARPFDVQAAGKIVRAVGTEFSVRLRSASSIEVLVRRGAVEINPPSNRPLLAGDSAVVGGDSMRLEKLDTEAVDRQLSWRGREGMLRFEGETLATVVNELNRHNARQILITDARFASLPIGGLVDRSDPERFVTNARKVLGRDVVRIEPEGNPTR